MRKISDVSISYIIAQLAPSSNNFLSNIIILFALGLDGFAEYSIVFLYFQYARQIFTFGLLSSYANTLPRIPKSTQFSYIIHIVFVALIFNVVVGVPLLYLLLYLGWPSDDIVITVLAFLIVIFYEIYKKTIFFVADIHGVAISEAIRLLVVIALLVSLFDILNIFLVYFCIFSSYIASLAQFGQVIPSVNWSWDKFWVSTRRTLRSCTVLVPSICIEVLQNAIPIVFLGYTSGAIAVGVIRAIQPIANILNLPSVFLQSFAVSMFARQRINRSDVRFQALKIGFYCLLYIATLSSVIAIFMPLIIGWLFSDSAYAADGGELSFTLILMLLLSFPIAVKTLIQAVLLVDRRNVSIFHSALVSLLFVMFFGWPIVRSLGLIGVPLTGIIAVSIQSYVLWSASRRC